MADLDELRHLAEEKVDGAKQFRTAVESLAESLDEIASAFVGAVDDREAFRAQAHANAEAGRAAVGKAGRLEAVLVQIATNARSTTHGVELKRIAQVAEAAIAAERKREA